MEDRKRERRSNLCRCREEDEVTASELPALPQEIIAEIFSWLPVKTLCRFRCVSKFFLSLVSDPRFARIHLDRILRNEALRFRSQRLLLSSDNLYSAGQEFIAGKSSFDGDLFAMELDYPLKYKPNSFSELVKRCFRSDFLYCGRALDDDENEYPVLVKLGSLRSLSLSNWISILGSSNGLVCISPAENTVFLFNPATGESKEILNPSTASLPGSHCDDLEAFGFGFDDVHEDYKVVRLVAGKGSAALVYSLQFNSWKDIGYLPYDFADSFYMSGVLLNGFIHWVVSKRDEDGTCLILAFDLADEEFEEIPLPEYVNSSCMHRFRDYILGVCGSSLCLVYCCHEMHSDIWLMREYGLEESWTRIQMNTSYRFMKPVCSFKNGDVLLEMDGTLVLYNLEGGTSKGLAVRGAQFRNGFEADTFIESLVSPNNFYRTLRNSDDMNLQN